MNKKEENINDSKEENPNTSDNIKNSIIIGVVSLTGLVITLWNLKKYKLRK